MISKNSVVQTIEDPEYVMLDFKNLTEALVAVE